MSADIRTARIAVGTGCAVIVGLLVIDYTINHFYKTGAYFWDSGMQGYYMSFSNEWPLHHHPAYSGDASAPGGSFFAIHFQPIFYLATALHILFSFVPPAAYFSVLQGFWSGILATSCFVFLASRRDITPASLALASFVAIATALNGTVLSMIGFPHIENAIPALFFAFLAARGFDRQKVAYISLALALSIREDAGLHIGIILALLATAQWVSRTGQEKVRANAVAAAICFGYSIIVFTMLYIFYQGDVSQLSRVYLGSPLFHHLNPDLIQNRIHIFFTAKAYAILPVILLLVVSALKRDLFLSVAPVAVLPWLFISLLAVSDTSGTLVSYYAFPTIFSIVWPSARYFLGRDHPSSSWLGAVVLQAITSVLSILLFVFLGAGNHDNAPWRGVGLPPMAAIGRDEVMLREVIGQHEKLDLLIVDDAVLSLVPEIVGQHEWVLKWSADRSNLPAGSIPCPDTVIYQPGAYDSGNTLQIIHECGLARRYSLSNTPFVLNSRRVIDMEELGK